MHLLECGDAPCASVCVCENSYRYNMGVRESFSMLSCRYNVRVCVCERESVHVCGNSKAYVCMYMYEHTHTHTHIHTRILYLQLSILQDTFSEEGWHTAAHLQQFLQGHLAVQLLCKIPTKLPFEKFSNCWREATHRCRVFLKKYSKTAS